MPHLIAVEVAGDLETSLFGGGKVKHKVRGEQIFKVSPPRLGIARFAVDWTAGRLNGIVDNDG